MSRRLEVLRLAGLLPALLLLGETKGRRADALSEICQLGSLGLTWQGEIPNVYI